MKKITKLYIGLVFLLMNKLVSAEHKVVFDYENYPQEREYIYNLATKHHDKEDTMLKSLTRKDDIGIAWYDIDNDGQKELFVYNGMYGWCGSQGCTFQILKFKDGKWKPFFWRGEESVTTGPDAITILDTSNLGIQDIKCVGCLTILDLMRSLAKLEIDNKNLSTEELLKKYIGDNGMQKERVFRWQGQYYDYYEDNKK